MVRYGIFWRGQWVKSQWATDGQLSFVHSTNCWLMNSFKKRAFLHSTPPPPLPLPVPLQRNQPTREAVDPGVASYSVCQNLSDVPLLLWWFHFLVYIQSEKAQNTPFQKMELHPSGFPIFWFQNLPRDDRLVLLPTFFQCSSWLLPSVVPSGGRWFGLEWGQPETREYPFSFMNKIQDKI